MRLSNFARSAIPSLILGCWVSISVPAAADPRVESPTARNEAASPVSSNGVGSQFELAFWQSLSSSEDRDQLEAYLAQYPNGTFSGLARAKMAALDRRDAGNAAPDKSLAANAVPAPANVAPSGPKTVSEDAPAATGLPVAAASGPTVPAVARTETVKPALLPPAPAAAPSPSAPAVGQSSMPPSLAEQLRALGQSQGRRPDAPASAPISQCVQSS